MFKPATSLLLLFFFLLISTLNVTTTAEFVYFGNYGPYEDILKNDINYINYFSNSNGTEISEPDAPAPPAAPGTTNSLVNKKKLVTKTVKPSHDSSATERVVPGAFFRESKLKKGTVMPMPNITDKMPDAKFLRQKFVSKIPFSSSKLSAMKQMFRAKDGSAMEFILKQALENCGRKPNPGEIKRCVATAEDMKEFAKLTLGPRVALRKTENNKGSKQNILIGSVTGVNGGKVTETVSCHRMLYPYLLYYCHSVPNVRVYEADILDQKTKEKINHGVAICHLDTSTWSPDHAAFKALGSEPGQIEVCHWIFEHDLIWTKADHY